MPLPTLRDLAALVAPPVDRSMLVKSMADMADAARMRTERAQQQQQFDALQANAMQRHADTLGFNYATLGETQRSNVAGEADALMGRQQTQRDRQTEVIAKIRAAAAQGAPPEVLRAMMLEAKAQNIPISEEMAQDPAPPPKQLGAFGGLNMRMGLQAPPPPEAPPPRPTGRFSIAGIPGAIDIPAIQADQRKQNAPALQAMVQGSRPADRSARNLAAMTSLMTPGQLPSEAVKTAQDIAEPQIRAETSERNSAALRLQAQQKLTDPNGPQARLAWIAGQNAVHKELKNHNGKELLHNINLMADGLEKIKSDRSPNGILTNQVAFSIVKANGVGQMSNQEYTRSIGGADIMTELANWYSTNTQGDLSPQQKARFREALQVNYQATKERLKRAYYAAEAARSRMPGAMQDGASAAIDSLFQDFDFYGKAPQVGGTDAADVGGGGASAGASMEVRGAPAAEILDLGEYNDISEDEEP